MSTYIINNNNNRLAYIINNNNNRLACIINNNNNRLAYIINNNNNRLAGIINNNNNRLAYIINNNNNKGQLILPITTIVVTHFEKTQPKSEFHFCTLIYILKKKRMRVINMLHTSKYLLHGQRYT